MGYLVSIIVFQAVFLLILLLTAKNKTTFDTFLALNLFLVSAHFSTKLFFLTCFENNLFYYKLPTSFALFYGPLLYLSTKSTYKKVSKKNAFFHLLPFLLVTVVFVIAVLQHRDNSYTSFYNSFSYSYLISTSIYPILSIRMLKKNKESITKPKLVLLERLAYLILGLTALVLILIALSFFEIDFDIRLTYILMLLSVISIFLYKMKASTEIEAPLKLIDKDASQKKYENSGLSQKNLIEYHEKLIRYCETKKPFLETDLTLQSLSEKINIPKHHLTQVLNLHLKKNFYQFINEYRIREAIKNIESGKKITMTDLAFHCGFNSKSTFNNYFKKMTSKTPKVYKKELNLAT